MRNARVKHAGGMAFGVALALWMLASPTAHAARPKSSRKPTCSEKCENHVRECSTVCNEEGGAGKQVCLDACKQAHQQCNRKCNQKGGGK